MANANLTVFKETLNDQTLRAKVVNSLGKDAGGAFLASMLDLYEGETELQKCDPAKVAMECVKAAALKLPLVKSLGFAYVVPFKGVPTFMVGYKGLIQLAQRTGQYRTINADVVYDGELNGHDKLSGEIRLDGQRKSDEVVGYFAFFETVTGFRKTLYMTKEAMEKWAKDYSPSYKSNYSPWKTEPDKMALKTCLRRLISTYGVMSTELQEAVTQDTDAQTRIDNEANANAAQIPVDPDTGEVINTTGRDVTPPEEDEEDDLP